MITKVREMLRMANKEGKGSKELKFEVKGLNNLTVRADCQLEISNRFEITRVITKIILIMKLIMRFGRQFVIQ